MANIGRIPRWVVENDPSWERNTDSDPAVIKWNKKGTNIQAISDPTSISCDIIGGDEIDYEAGLPDLISNFMIHNKVDVLSGKDITRYLSSRYLNTRMNNPPPRSPGAIGFDNNRPYRKSWI